MRTYTIIGRAVLNFFGYGLASSGDTASALLTSAIVLDGTTQTADKQSTSTTETAACKPHKFETMTRPVTNMI
ncbi:MAG: hypothetical protein GY796_11015 [Chloroflexi bacterium]|nr:hypothetical protein [Chloroflexota bacterium]